MAFETCLNSSTVASKFFKEWHFNYSYTLDPGHGNTKEEGKKGGVKRFPDGGLPYSPLT